MPVTMIGKDEKRCVNCRYYVQHYATSGFWTGYMPINYGHCTERYIKARRPGDGCERWADK